MSSSAPAPKKPNSNTEMTSTKPATPTASRLAQTNSSPLLSKTATYNVRPSTPVTNTWCCCFKNRPLLQAQYELIESNVEGYVMLDTKKSPTHK